MASQYEVRARTCDSFGHALVRWDKTYRGERYLRDLCRRCGRSFPVVVTASPHTKQGLREQAPFTDKGN